MTNFDRIAEIRHNEYINNLSHDKAMDKGLPGHAGPYAATCHACFKANKQVVGDASPMDAADAREHLSSQQWKEMFGK